MCGNTLGTLIGDLYQPVGLCLSLLPKVHVHSIDGGKNWACLFRFLDARVEKGCNFLRN